MKYFSGFSLTNEEELFREFIIDSEFCVAGFSYGAIRAFEYALTSKKRVDRLILLSPAFFQNKSKAFIRAQLRYFKRDKSRYIKEFLKNASYPSNIDLNQYLKIGTLQELEYLLNYKWKPEKIKKLQQSGVKIEVFLAEQDKIIDSKEALKLFSSITTTYYLKNRGHILH